MSRHLHSWYADAQSSLRANLHSLLIKGDTDQTTDTAKGNHAEDEVYGFSVVAGTVAWRGVGQEIKRAPPPQDCYTLIS